MNNEKFRSNDAVRVEIVEYQPSYFWKHQMLSVALKRLRRNVVD